MCDPAFWLIQKSDAMSSAAAFECFRREANVLLKNMAKKLQQRLQKLKSK